MKTYSDTRSGKFWFKTIFAICNDKLYICSSLSFHAGACFNVAKILALIWFSEGLFFAIFYKTGSKEKW